MSHTPRRTHALHRSLARGLAVALLAPTLVVLAGPGAHAGPLDDLLGAGPCLPLPGIDDCDTAAPETLIDTVTPTPVDGYVTTGRVSFAFSAVDDREDATLSFECRLVRPADQEPAWSSCDATEGAAYDVSDSEADGYRFEVRATDDAVTFPAEPSPNTDATPAVQSFGVDTTAPDTFRFSGPRFYEPSRVAEFVHGSSDAGDGFVCTLDRRPVACDEQYLKLVGLSSGRHRVTVAAVDARGNVDPTPEATTWWVPRNRIGTTSERSRWTKETRAGAFDGDVLVTEQRRAQLSRKVTRATRIGVVVEKGRDRGRLRVAFNRTRLGVIDLAQPRQGTETVEFDLPGRTRRAGTVRLVPLDDKTVAVDAFFAS
ncbi:hypothetical protein KLP28_06950 [Nocardioidaceae bacterium]|nr:hypothetical protein KLP28_06950 [Nocardioidaceae bacterium]